MLRGAKPSFTHEQNWIFRDISLPKEFACRRAEKARGCFGSDKVREIANMFSSRNLDICLLQRELSKQKN